MRPWPRCTCGGPAAPKGPAPFACLVEVRTVSEANSREHFAVKSKRARAQREAVAESMALALGAGQQLPAGPWYVRLTRLSKGKLDDDNLGRALKSPRDTVAAALGVDDGSDAVAFTYRQAKGAKVAGLTVEIWGAP